MMRALLLLCAAGLSGIACGAQPLTLGRLFFTPQERAQLDSARTHKQQPQPVASAEPVEPVAPQIITYSGIVRRSDGKSILWLNSRAAEEKEALSSLPVTGRVRPDGAVTLQVPHGGGSVDLKVGQRAELHTGRIAEGRASAPGPLQKNEAPKTGADESLKGKAEKQPRAAEQAAAGRTTQPAEDQRPGARAATK